MSTKCETFSGLHITLLQVPSLLSSIICIEGLIWQLLFWQSIFDDANLMEKQSMFKATVFFRGSPPLSGDGKSLLLLDVLDRPALRLHTYHVIGLNDPMLCTSMALIKCV